MKVKLYEPCSFLKGYIRYYWSLENQASDHTEFVYPTGDLQILFHYKTPFIEKDSTGNLNKQYRFNICGQRITHADVISKTHSGMIGVVFYPHTPSIFLQSPMLDIKNFSVDLNDIFKDWKYSENKFLNLDNDIERIKFIENYLLKKMEIPNKNQLQTINSCIIEMKRNRGFNSINKISKLHNISEKTLQRLFNHYVGISPKKYSDILSINHSIRLFKTNKDLLDITYEAGFYDQSHFIRTMKKYTGYTPAELRKVILSCEMSHLYNENKK